MNVSDFKLLSQRSTDCNVTIQRQEDDDANRYIDENATQEWKGFASDVSEVPTFVACEYPVDEGKWTKH